MSEEEFRTIAEAQWNAMPEKYASRIKNVALLVEDEPSTADLLEEEVEKEGTLLGLYRGVPNTARGSDYGVGGTLPDTITLYRLPILAEAEELTDDAASEFRKQVAKVVRETLWHEIGHYFGLDEEPINRREADGTNKFNP